jgi:hypothetical protein
MGAARTALSEVGLRRATSRPSGVRFVDSD